MRSRIHWIYSWPIRLIIAVGSLWSLYAIMRFGLGSGTEITDEARIVGAFIGLIGLYLFMLLLKRLYVPTIER